MADFVSAADYCSGDYRVGLGEGDHLEFSLKARSRNLQPSTLGIILIRSNCCEREAWADLSADVEQHTVSPLLVEMSHPMLLLSEEGVLDASLCEKNAKELDALVQVCSALGAHIGTGLVFAGESEAGFLAMYLASRVSGSRAVVWNLWTDVATPIALNTQPGHGLSPSDPADQAIRTAHVQECLTRVGAPHDLLTRRLPSSYLCVQTPAGDRSWRQLLRLLAQDGHVFRGRGLYAAGRHKGVIVSDFGREDGAIPSDTLVAALQRMSCSEGDAWETFKWLLGQSLLGWTAATDIFEHGTGPSAAEAMSRIGLAIRRHEQATLAEVTGLNEDQHALLFEFKAHSSGLVVASPPVTTSICWVPDAAHFDRIECRVVDRTGSELALLHVPVPMGSDGLVDAASPWPPPSSHFVRDPESWQMIREAPGGWVITLPTGYELSIDEQDGVDWYGKNTPVPTRSDLLWIWSLWPVAGGLLDDERALEAPSHARCAGVLVESFLNAEKDPQFLADLIIMPSRIQGASVRLRALTRYLVFLRSTGNADSALLADIAASITRWSAWLAAPSQEVNTNHDLMSSLALMTVAGHFPQWQGARKVTDVALTRVERLIEVAVDDDGMWNENSPHYHALAIQLLEDFLSVAESVCSGDRRLRAIRDMIGKTRQAFAACLAPDGQIALIGDSIAGKSDIPPVEGSRCFQQSGLTIIKRDDMYLTFIAGSSSEHHKHQDDLSFAVRWRGQDILVDAGSYKYDLKDPIRQSVESARGHSGISHAMWESMPRRDLISRGSDYRASTDEFADEDAVTTVAGSITDADGAIRVTRELAVVWPDRVVVRDRARSDEGCDPRGWVRRLLFAPDVEVGVDGHRIHFEIHFEGEAAKGRLDLTLSDDDRIDVFRGAGPEGCYKGWFAPTRTEVLAATLVEVWSPRACADLRAELVIEDHG